MLCILAELENDNLGKKIFFEIIHKAIIVEAKTNFLSRALL